LKSREGWLRLSGIYRKGDLIRIDFFKTASKIGELPLLNRLSPAAPSPTRAECAGFLESQRLAQRAVTEVASKIQLGWTEKKAAELVNTHLKQAGVRAFFHEAFAWFGERSRFTGMRSYRDAMPSDRRIWEGDVFILDVAPIHRGFSCDVAFTGSLGPNPRLDEAQRFLARLRADLPSMFDGRNAGEDIWFLIDEKIRDAGFDNIHKKYPFSVLGHRVHRLPTAAPGVTFRNFGWQSYWSLLSRGLFGQLLNENYNGGLMGLWALEPHLGGPGFGAKFEEILVVPGYGAKPVWLGEQAF
jgi:hypothetical protein